MIRTPTSTPRRWGRGLALALAAGLLATGVGAAPARADVYLTGLTTTTVFDSSTPLVDGRGQRAEGLRNGADRAGVSNLGFGPHGELLVAEKGGRLVYFTGVKADHGTVLTSLTGADLSSETLNVGDAGLGGAVLDPGWPSRPYVYVLYLSNARLNGQGAGRWTNAECATGGTCMVDAKLERLTIRQRTLAGSVVPYIDQRTVLLGGGWCQAARTHSVGALTFGPDGKLYVAAGDGTPTTDGTLALQAKICAPTVTTKYPSRYDALDALDPSVTPSYNGKILRLDPATGAAPWDNPGGLLGSVLSPQRSRIIAMGFRNPYRMRFQPGTGTLAVSAIGENRTEAVYLITNRLAGPQTLNAGWPCWEVGQRYGTLPQCASLSPDRGNVLKPYVSWTHGQPFATGEPCSPGTFGSSAMGVTWASKDLRAGSTPNTLLWGDYARGCLWARQGQAPPFFVASFPDHSVRDLTTGPDGTVYFVDHRRGEVRRLLRA